jgi:hypothetical protein
VPMALVISTVLSAQRTAWVSAWGGAGMRLYSAGNGAGSEWVAGIRYGQDLGKVVRVMIGMERAHTHHRTHETLHLFVPPMEMATTYTGEEWHGQLLFAIRLGSKDRNEWRMSLGVEFGQTYRLHAERWRSYNGAQVTEQAEIKYDRAMGGPRLGLRHARIVKGPLWVFAEPWVGLAFEGERTIGSPWPNERYIALPRRVATMGFALGLEIGPRAAPRPE